jgi:hypothetical protein
MLLTRVSVTLSLSLSLSLSPLVLTLEHRADFSVSWSLLQTVGPIGRVISPNIHAFCGIRTHDSGFRESEDSTCLRPLGYRDRQLVLLAYINYEASNQYIYYAAQNYRPVTFFVDMQ